MVEVSVVAVAAEPEAAGPEAVVELVVGPAVAVGQVEAKARAVARPRVARAAAGAVRSTVQPTDSATIP